MSAGQDEFARECGCYSCTKQRDDVRENPTFENMEIGKRFIACEVCGNKRCPKATDHRLACTNSNEPGQTGSRFA